MEFLPVGHCSSTGQTKRQTSGDNVVWEKIIIHQKEFEEYLENNLLKVAVSCGKIFSTIHIISGLGLWLISNWDLHIAFHPCLEIGKADNRLGASQAL